MKLRLLLKFVCEFSFRFTFYVSKEMNVITASTPTTLKGTAYMAEHYSLLANHPDLLTTGIL